MTERTKARWMVLILTLMAAALRFHLLGRQSLWFDEAFSWICAIAPLRKGIEFALENMVHPPLYYLFLRPFAAVAATEFALRAPSAWVGVFSVPVTYALTRRFIDEDTGLLAAAILAVTPFHLWYSREARMYAMLFPLSLGIGFCFYRAVTGGKLRHWVCLGLASMLGYLTHYFALLLGLSQAVYILRDFRNRYRHLRIWALTQVLAAFPLLLWFWGLYSLPRKAIGIGWIPRPGLMDPVLTLWNFSTLVCAPMWCPWLVSFVPFGVALLIVLGFRKHPSREWLLTWLGFPIVFVWILSLMLPRHFYVDRFFVVSLPAYVISISKGASSITRKGLRFGLIAALLAASLAGAVRVYADPGLWREDWKGALAHVRGRARQGDTVAFVKIEEILMAKYYGVEGDLRFLDQVPLESLWNELGPGERLWLVLNVSKAWAHAPVHRRSEETLERVYPRMSRWLRSHPEYIRERREFTGIVVLLLEKPHHSPNRLTNIPSLHPNLRFDN